MFEKFFKSQRREASAGKQTGSGATVPARIVYASGGNALECAAFYHAVDLRAGTFARANIVLERYNRAKGAWQRNIDNITFADEYRHLQYLLTVRPNKRMTATQMWRKLSVTRDMEGCAAIYLIRDAKYVFQMIPCNGVSYNSADETFNLSSDEFMKSWTNVSPDDVILLRGLSTQARMLGEPLWRVANRELTLQLTANDFITKTYAKGGTFRAIVKQEGGQDPMKDLTTAFNDEEVKKNTETMQDKLNGGMDLLYDPSASQITNITQSFQDLQIDLQTTKSIENIARVAGVPLPLMFCSTNAVYKSIDDAWHTFLSLTIEPMWEQVCEELNAKYLGEENWGVLRFRYDSTNICLDSESIRATTASSRRSAGITTANEERALIGLPPIEGGDTISQSSEVGVKSSESKSGEGGAL